MAGQAQTGSGPNMAQFEAYFQRADLDRDGRISGQEAVSFFQGSNLSKQVLAQIWTYADRNRTGFLGRAEFYNALKLVTVAQSRRELTPELVQAALYGAASDKIPAPQINLAVIPSLQSNTGAGTPATGVAGPPTASQNIGIRGPQGVQSQPNQFMRPPRPQPPTTAFSSQPNFATHGVPGGGPMATPNPPTSFDALSGRPGGSQGGVTSQLPNRGTNISPSLNQDVSGVSSLPTQPRQQITPVLAQPGSIKPNDTASLGHQVGAKDSKAFTATGNGFTSDSVFGDIFSVSASQPKQHNPVPPSSMSSPPVSSSIIQTPSASQPTVGAGALELSKNQQPVNSQLQQPQLTAKPPPVSAQTSTAPPVGTGNMVSVQPQLPWPKMTQLDVQKYNKVFVEVDTDRDGKIAGPQARNLFLSWRLPIEVLKQVWDLSDQDNDSMLSLREFCIALYLMERYREGRPLPTVLPSNIVDNSLFPATGQPAAMQGNTAWRPAPGWQQQQGSRAPRAATSAGVGKPPRPVPIPQPDESAPPRQKAKVPVLEKHLVDQLSTEEQNSLNSKFQEATDAEKKVAELEKEISDAREKIQFYHAKMQELILYKSRCDNRLNEITERVSADKREVESLAKKYEEKYKQAGDVASKLTIEEATFRDIQEKKMELYRAIVKMEQDGDAEGIQDRVNRIHLELEELVKGLNERCKIYGLRAKPTSLVELPFGWQPGIQEGAADWDEDWDKFEDEGFTFVKELTLDVQNVIAPPRPKTALPREKAPSMDDGATAKSSSITDAKSDKLPNAASTTSDNGGANPEVEDRKERSPHDSPAKSNATESPSKEFQDFKLRNDVGLDNSPRATDARSEHWEAESVLSGDKHFDEPTWGNFDSQYDTDSAWDFNKDPDHERHAENSLFGSDNWSLNPIKTGSTEKAFQKQGPFFDSVPSTPNYNMNSTIRTQSPFFDSVPSTPNYNANSTLRTQSPFFDSVPSTPNYNSTNSPSADSMFQRKSPFAFADSVPSTPMFSSSNSPRKFGEGAEDRYSFDNFSRFDSFNMHDGGPFASRDFSRFDSMRSTRDSDFDSGFASRESLTRFDSFRSTADSEYNHGLFPPRDSLTRFDSIRSTRDTDFGNDFPSFDDSDPFGSTEPFKVSVESQTPRRDSDSWKAF